MARAPHHRARASPPNRTAFAVRLTPWFRKPHSIPMSVVRRRAKKRVHVPKDPDALLTDEQVAYLLQLCPRGVQKLEHTHGLIPLRIGSSVRYMRETLRAFYRRVARG